MFNHVYFSPQNICLHLDHECYLKKQHTLNISFICYPEVKQVLPEVVGMLPNNDTGTDLPTEVTVSLCQILINLSQSNMQHVRAIVNQRALPKIINISSKDNGLVCAKFIAAHKVLLYETE